MTPEQVVYRSHTPRVVVIARGGQAVVEVNDNIWLKSVPKGIYAASKSFGSWNEACRFAERWIADFDRMRHYSNPEIKDLEDEVRELRKEQEIERDGLKAKLKGDFND